LALSATAGGASTPRQPGAPDAEASGAASERPIIADAGPIRMEAKHIASAASLTPFNGTVSANASASDPTAEGLPPPGRHDGAKPARPEFADKNESPTAPQTIAPTALAPPEMGTLASVVANYGVVTMVAPAAVTPDARDDSPRRDRDSAAALGVAATARAQLAPSDARDKTEPALALSTASEESPTRVFVASQKTWLEPVRPDFVPAPHGPDARSGAGAPAPAEAEAQTVSQTVEAPAPADAAVLIPQPRAENLAAPVSSAARPAVAAGVVADPAATPRAAALRRDLDVTLEPRELGGLALRMKSVGDRLEIAFVADKGDTARMIGDGSGTLASQLRDAGLGLGGVAISVETKPDVAAGTVADHVGQDVSAGAQGQGGRQGNGEQDVTPRRHQIFGGGRQEHRNESVGNGDDARARRDDRGLYL
jgi:hypothetical protein